MNFKVVIPSRLSSQRLPGKPLEMVQGVPMVIRVAQICQKVVGDDGVVVATPDQQIADICKSFSIDTFSSSSKCNTGTERLVEYASQFNFDRYFNVQGDEPMLPSRVLKAFIAQAKHSEEPVVGVSVITSQSEAEDKSVVKVAISRSRIIYASRVPLPSSVVFSSRYFKHTGLYSFSRSNLEAFSNLKIGNLEKSENIEVLRFLENRHNVNSVVVPNYGRSVDTPDDLAFVNNKEIELE